MYFLKISFDIKYYFPMNLQSYYFFQEAQSSFYFSYTKIIVRRTYRCVLGYKMALTSCIFAKIRLQSDLLVCYLVCLFLSVIFLLHLSFLRFPRSNLEYHLENKIHVSIKFCKLILTFFHKMYEISLSLGHFCVSRRAFMESIH